MNTRRLLWTALAGLVLGILGVIWDRSWHSRHPDALAGGAEVMEAHWLIILGILIVFGALTLAVRSIRQSRSAVATTWIAFAGSVSMVIGFAWDSVRHIQGTESATAHAMIYGGLVLVIVAVPTVLLLMRKAAEF